MNLPNKLTVFRIILIPFYLVFLFLEISRFHFLIAAVIFVAASLTDLFDGKIARKYNLVTVFGKFADPLADKLLVISALVAFVELEFMPAWICIIIIAREITISGVRLICAENGTVIAASKWGKVKTTFQMTFVIMTTLNVGTFLPETAAAFVNIYEIVRIAVMYIALALTLISLADYIIKNRKAFSEGAKN